MISCPPFLYPSPMTEHSLGYTLLVPQVLSSTEIRAHRPAADRTRSPIWTIRTPEPRNYLLGVLDKTSASSSVALLKPSWELSCLPLMTWSGAYSSGMEGRITVPRPLACRGPIPILPHPQSNFLKQSGIWFLQYLKGTVSLQGFSLPHLSPSDARAAASQ